MSSAPLIGSRISLISKKEIRYEGILYDINKRDATIALKNVRSFGTEDREAPIAVKPSQDVHEFVKFRGMDIRDLHVHQEPAGATPAPVQGATGVPKNNSVPAAVAPTPPPPPPVPSTVGAVGASAPRPPPAQHAPAQRRQRQQQQQQPPRAQQQQQQQQPPAPSNQPPKSKTPAWSSGPPTMARAQARPAPQPRQAGQPNHQRQAAPGTGGGPRPMPGMGASLVNRRLRGGPGSVDDVSRDFDFTSANLAFDKEREKASLSSGAVGQPVVVKKYNPSSFFDELSCDALDAQAGQRGKFSMSEERKKNSETFGAESIQINRRRMNNEGTAARLPAVEAAAAVAGEAGAVVEALSRTMVFGTTRRQAGLEATVDADVVAAAATGAAAAVAEQAAGERALAAAVAEGSGRRLGTRQVSPTAFPT
eukprot:CAMPEP_0118964054 /NCGR_PEP_ID=MMETSP1173-20130426/1830_1 /TAXON_ID=1034831 /ORGANISM="Rhizochromulina marina cf, Strain CCMP1243" /LENGTH=421 /DNA_ID=CAMNT_0006912475 /DNA_START=104 /DNA_END=1370 /DNA_ORIENTATION=-